MANSEISFYSPFATRYSLSLFDNEALNGPGCSARAAIVNAVGSAWVADCAIPGVLQSGGNGIRRPGGAVNRPRRNHVFGAEADIGWIDLRAGWPARCK